MKHIKLRIVLTSLITMGALAAPAYTYAEGSSGSGSESGTTTSHSGDTSGGTTETHTSSSGPFIEPTTEKTETEAKDTTKTEVETHTAQQKTKRCEKRQADVNKITARVAERGQKQIDLFSTIATKVEAFYAKQGKTLSNYNDLVAAVDTAKTNAQTAVDTIKNTTVTLKCDGTDPNGAGASFKSALKTEIQALKDYRTAVKNLIVGVKSVQGTTSSGDKANNEGSQQ